MIFDEKTFPLTKQQAEPDPPVQHARVQGRVVIHPAAPAADNPGPQQPQPARPEQHQPQLATPEHQQQQPPVPSTPIAPNRHYTDLKHITPPPRQPDFGGAEESPDPLAIQQHLALMTSAAAMLPEHENFALPTSDPMTWKEAQNSENSARWLMAADEEYDDLLKKRKVYEPVERAQIPSTAKILGSKFVFKTKRNMHGAVTKYKARLCAQGYNQRAGVDYSETSFAPVVRFSSIRTLVAIAAVKGYHIIQADVNKAFLEGELEEELYITLPRGYAVPGVDVLRLRKAIY